MLSKKDNRALGIVRKIFPKVTRVEDANQSITVEVTAQDAKTSSRKSHKHCAMAVACQRKAKATGVIMSVSTAYIIKGKKATRYRVPQSVAREIVAFDRDSYFEPGIYRLLSPPPANRLGARRGGEFTTPGAGKKRSGYQHMTGGIRTSLKSE